VGATSVGAGGNVSVGAAVGGASVGWAVTSTGTSTVTTTTSAVGGIVVGAAGGASVGDERASHAVSAMTKIRIRIRNLFIRFSFRLNDYKTTLYCPLLPKQVKISHIFLTFL
jgi:hypothetical protein